MKRSEVDKNKLSPMMKQYMDIKDNYEDIILMFRLGDFYEMFFEDGMTVAHELELVLTGKNAGLDERIPMCGIPYHALNPYLDKLIDKGYKVAICEQVEDPKDAKGVVKREVVNVVSRGTVMNSDSLVESENNYIGCVVDFDHAYAISYSDISTGEFNVIMINHTLSDLINEVLNLNLNELIVDDKTDKKLISILKKNYHLPVSVYDNIIEIETYKHLYSHINDIRLITAIKQLITYLNETQKRNLSHLQTVVVRENSKTLKMDIHTKRGLELTENVRTKNRNYSLLWLLDKTKTAMGSRLLKQFIEQPLIDIFEINKRYDMVTKLLDEFILKEELRTMLYQVYDLERLSGKIAYGSANGKDLLQLRNSIKNLPEISKILTDLSFYQELELVPNLYSLLDRSIYDNPPISIKEGYLIKEGYNEELDTLKDIRSGGKDFLNKIEIEEKEKTGIKNLKVGYNKVFGYYIEISKGSVGQLPEDSGYERKQTLSTGERYITPLLKEKEALILGAEEKIVNIEYNLFMEIKEEVKQYIPIIQRIAKTLALVDVLQSYATVTEENNYVRPELTNDNIINIIGGRHPVVEKVMDNEYVPNDIIMDNDTNIFLITGPNMAGKSTYLRQMAIMTIMAQIGCFVPCKSAIMPVFDSIYTRIGANDDLVSGESTFMVEMNEANNAISNATEHSLILFDELGRGTATYDGISLAHAILEYIHDNIKCKTMFSTHYHELISLENDLKYLKNKHVSAKEEDGEITFLHKIKDGAVDKSYGIHVAKLAHLPDTLIKRAALILKTYENDNVKKEVITQLSLPLVEVVEDKVAKRLKNINPLEITPLEALNILAELKELQK